MTSPEIPSITNEISPEIIPDNGSFELTFSDGMEPIKIPEVLNAENYKEELGSNLPEELEEILRGGGTMALSE